MTVNGAATPLLHSCNGWLESNYSFTHYYSMIGASRVVSLSGLTAGKLTLNGRVYVYDNTNASIENMN